MKLFPCTVLHGDGSLCHSSVGIRIYGSFSASELRGIAESDGLFSVDFKRAFVHIAVSKNIRGHTALAQESVNNVA